MNARYSRDTGDDLFFGRNITTGICKEVSSKNERSIYGYNNYCGNILAAVKNS